MRNDKELIVYALEFLMLNIEDDVEDDLKQEWNTLERRIKKLITRTNNAGHFYTGNGTYDCITLMDHS